MFSKKDKASFLTAGLLVTAGFALMSLDTAENGFGVYTLWIAPPLLLAGFLLPVYGILGVDGRGVSFAPWKSDRLKHAFGCLAFLISFITYLFTLEPTASLWDCSEFIAAAFKLQVPHTPGTPLALLLGRFFSFIALGNVANVAWAMNLMSGFFSASTVFLLFYIIYYFGENLSTRSQGKTPLIFASFGGSLCLAFSDTFWFSAVEAETYGPACFFLLLLLWLILTGKALEGPAKPRRLVLIFYAAGLAYCVHPMCLLAIPVLPFAWYTAGRKVTLKHTVVSICAGLGIVLVINRFVAVGLFELAFSFDLVLVNFFHLPFYSGVFVLFIALIFVCKLVLTKFHRLRPFIWASIFLVFGFTPYMLLFIRSNHNPPIDETNPENLAMIKAYMNRESYPSRPLLYGPYFDARIEDISTKKQVYYKSRETYEVAGSLPEYHYNSRQTILPRIYSNDAAHIETYRKWTGLKPNERPRYSDNLEFMFRYQLGHMYLRYLMWNFAGRESDVQNSGWLKPWDRLSDSPFEKARNQYWMIPLILGIAGAVAQFRKDRKGFISTGLFFLITGVVLVLYLNSTPNEPRERDYIYVGSYIAFCIWIGLGILSLLNYAAKPGWRKMAACLISIAVPAWMLYQNYDDHDRSGRTFQVDNARNILNSCAPHSILFTGGDNDTFPLWYLQEVEGVRTDVRVMVLSYMNTDWYINQLRKTYYDSGAFEFTLDEGDYRQYGPNDVLYLQESIGTAIDAKQYLQLLKEKHPGLRQISRNGDPYHILPSRSLRLTSPNAGRKTQDEMIFTVDNDYLSKNALALVDLILSNKWKRPIHFNFTSANTLGLDLTPFLQQEGLVYRLVPKRSDSEDMPVNSALAYRNLVTLGDYRDLQDSSVHFSYEDHYARILVPLRQSFNALAIAFIEEGNSTMAEKVMVEAIDKLYPKHLRASYTNLQAAEILRALNRDQDADRLTKAAFEYYFAQVKTDVESGKAPDDIERYLLRQSAQLLSQSGKPTYLQKIKGI